MNGTIIVAESGADISSNMASTYGINILPMHISMNGESFDDGSDFPVQRIFEYHKQTGKLPTTSATNPEEYNLLFQQLHNKYPDKQILHLCYSAVTTATWQNAHIGSEGMDYVRHVDTKNVSGGQAVVVLKVAQFLQEHPLAPIEDIVNETERWIKRVRFGFFSGDLDYLRAGGRVSNATYIGATLLSIKPLIELIDGKLVATKKYRGPMKKVCKKLVSDFTNRHNLETESLFLLFSEGLPEKLKEEVEGIAKEVGYLNILWIKAGGVISTHGGPGAFGMIGIAK
ncbi:MAG TPA: DegV family protein [Epulopiscium sp.]|nr:DegV family protein [Candidatus Epulonipiscium sp.]